MGDGSLRAPEIDERGALTGGTVPVVYLGGHQWQSGLPKIGVTVLGGRIGEMAEPMYYVGDGRWCRRGGVCDPPDWWTEALLVPVARPERGGAA